MQNYHLFCVNLKFVRLIKKSNNNSNQCHFINELKICLFILRIIHYCNEFARIYVGDGYHYECNSGFSKCVNVKNMIGYRKVKIFLHP